MERQQPNHDVKRPEVIMDDPKPEQRVSVWDAHWTEIIAVFIAGWWIGMMMH